MAFPGVSAYGAGLGMHDMGTPMPGHHAMWTPGYAAVVLAMWAVMMAAMMLPSAAPMAAKPRPRHRHVPRRRRPSAATERACCWQIRFGAGEGIRTLDPNLGKVVLYP